MCREWRGAVKEDARLSTIMVYSTKRGGHKFAYSSGDHSDLDALLDRAGKGQLLRPWLIFPFLHAAAESLHQPDDCIPGLGERKLLSQTCAGRQRDQRYSFQSR